MRRIRAAASRFRAIVKWRPLQASKAIARWRFPRRLRTLVMLRRPTINSVQAPKALYTFLWVHLSIGPLSLMDNTSDLLAMRRCLSESTRHVVKAFALDAARKRRRALRLMR